MSVWDETNDAHELYDNSELVPWEQRIQALYREDTEEVDDPEEIQDLLSTFANVPTPWKASQQTTRQTE
jgi:hypothetical protein